MTASDDGQVEKLLHSTRPIVIYGAGIHGSHLYEYLAQQLGLGCRIKGFIDSNPYKRERKMKGLTVYPPDADELRVLRPLIILAATQAWQRQQMRNTCSGLECECVDYNDVMPSDNTDAQKNVSVQLDEKYFLSPDRVQCISIDLVDSCNLNCVNCIRLGRKPVNNPKNVMSMELFRQIIDKAAAIGFTDTTLYKWTEPFLYPHIEEAAKYSKEKGLDVALSTNLSLERMPALIPTLAHCRNILVSVSGFTQEVHERNHHGSKIATIKRHLDTIAEAKRKGVIQTLVEVKYLDFDYNRNEIEDFRNYALALGLEFMVEHGSLRTPTKKDFDSDVIDVFGRFADVYAEKRRDSILTPCQDRDGGFILDYKGDAFLCCRKLSTPFFRVGNFLRDDFLLLQALRQTHPYCALCDHEWMANTPMNL